jgi:hypothetical protein
MAITRIERESELRSIAERDWIQLIRIYQVAMGTPHGQIPIPGPSQSKMIDLILKREFPLSNTE